MIQVNVGKACSQAIVFIDSCSPSHLISISLLGNSGSQIPTAVTLLDVMNSSSHRSTSCPFHATAFQSTRLDAVHDCCDLLNLALGLETLQVEKAMRVGLETTGGCEGLDLTVSCGGKDGVDLTCCTFAVTTELGRGICDIGNGVVESGKTTTEKPIFVAKVLVLDTEIWVMQVGVCFMMIYGKEDTNSCSLGPQPNFQPQTECESVEELSPCPSRNQSRKRYVEGHVQGLYRQERVLHVRLV
jgi:hypothetical protein